MRTDAEILDRIKAVEDDDWMGTTRGDLIMALSWEAAKPHITEKAVAAGPDAWAEGREGTDEKVLAVMAEYIGFAVGKATDHRGLSAGRSIDHFRAWVWLLGDEHYAAIDWDDYTNYGAPILRQIADKYGFEVETDEDFDLMAQGKPCTSDYPCGCGA